MFYFPLSSRDLQKKTTDTLTYKHYNIIGFVIKKTCEKLKAKIKTKRKKIIITKKKTQSF